MTDRRPSLGRPEHRAPGIRGATRVRSGTPVAADELQVSPQAVVAVPLDAHGAGMGTRVWSALNALMTRDALVLGSLLVFAAAVRLVGLQARGAFDGDQGHDMLTLLRLVRDGTLPLLGPPTSVGDFHHGAAYYYLLAPIAWLFGPDPTAVVGFLAVLGTAAVGLTWWLTRAIGGRAAGLMAGLLLAVSPAAIDESTFIWNPSPIPFFAILALAAAWRGHQTGRRGWWVVAVAASGMVVQLHVLGVVFVPVVLAFGIAEWRRARRSGDGSRARETLLGLGVGILLLAALFIPLLVHELQSGFGETRNAVAYFTAAAPPAGQGGVLDPFERLVFTILRVIGWPLVGLITSAPFAAIVLVSLAVVLGTWRFIVARGEERLAVRWLGLTVAWSALALTFLAPSLQTVVAGLPNDHYHAFLDPVVIVLLALGFRAVAAGSGLETGVDRTARLVVAGIVLAIVAVDVSRWPPLTEPNGGWSAARAAGTRIAAASPDALFDVRGLPLFKTAEGIGFPIVAAGRDAVIATDEASAGRPAQGGSTIVIVCDRLFESILGARCGGPAEAAFMARIPGLGTTTASPILVEVFDASPRTSISIYRVPGLKGSQGSAGSGGQGPGQQPQLPVRRLRVLESRTPAPRTPAFAVPETRTWRTSRSLSDAASTDRRNAPSAE